MDNISAVLIQPPRSLRRVQFDKSHFRIRMIVNVRVSFTPLSINNFPLGPTSSALPQTASRHTTCCPLTSSPIRASNPLTSIHTSTSNSAHTSSILLTLSCNPRTLSCTLPLTTPTPPSTNKMSPTSTTPTPADLTCHTRNP